MSTKSRETHIHAPQEAVVLWMEWMLYNEEDIETFEITDLPQSKQACDRLEKDLRISLCVVSPTDTEGWTTIWSRHAGPFWDEEWTRILSAYTQALAITGKRHDGMWHWEWQRYHNGDLHSHYSSHQARGQSWYEHGQGVRPPDAMSVEEAFASLGRTYHHWPFSLPWFLDDPPNQKVCIIRSSSSTGQTSLVDLEEGAE